VARAAIALAVQMGAPVGPADRGVSVVFSVGSIALASLRFQPKPWNATRFTDVLHGRILSDTGVTRGLISMAGNGTGMQKVLVRADLLFAPQQLLSTSFQMEYLPSGLICRGRVTHVHNFGFEATCSTPHGPVRDIMARWRPSRTPQIEGGVLQVTTA
jgi:hypothetical protein